MELNFFDTSYNMSINIFLLGGKPLSFYFLFSFVSKYGHDNAERIVTVVVAIVVVEIEHSCIGLVVVIATTIEERPASVREVRVIV